MLNLFNCWRKHCCVDLLYIKQWLRDSGADRAGLARAAAPVTNSSYVGCRCKAYGEVLIRVGECCIWVTRRYKIVVQCYSNRWLACWQDGNGTSRRPYQYCSTGNVGWLMKGLHGTVDCGSQSHLGPFISSLTLALSDTSHLSPVSCQSLCLASTCRSLLQEPVAMVCTEITNANISARESINRCWL